MDSREYRKTVAQMARKAAMMSVEGLQASILDDWNNPQWPAIMFDAMNKALERKMGRTSYAQWFNNLPVKA
jgi:hypothetical protein